MPIGVLHIHMEDWADAKERRRPTLGQASLSDHEKRRLPLGNQNTSIRKKSICKWRCVKAAAVYYEVTDWTAKVDSKLTYQENISLMRQRGTHGADAGSSVKFAPIGNLEARPRQS